jgi:outer membrane protein assembly factor BamE (lipoprotein component of BamABCDE complex)
MTDNPSRRRVLGGLAGAAGAMLAGCSAVIDYRGYLPRGRDIKKLQVGQTKGEVTSLLGSPSTTATINTNNDSFYYISSVVERFAFYAPKVIDREILAVHFSPEGRVLRFGHYGLKDGKVIDVITRETPTRGRELTILQQLFYNIGRFGGG